MESQQYAEIEMRSLSGSWYNKKGSKLELIVHQDGTIEGEYHTAVGCDQNVFHLSGRADTKDYAGSRSIGFVVCWNNARVNLHSVTVWSGQYHLINGEETLSMTWLLTKESAPEDAWASTHIGSDVFSRTPPQVQSVMPEAEAHPYAPCVEEAELDLEAITGV